nr:hypothetical protein [Tanacetum cinerariifolium]
FVIFHVMMMVSFIEKKQQMEEAKVKTLNGEEQIQALVDKEKVIITDTSVRSDLHLEDAEGTECLPTAIIFEQLKLMSQVEDMLKHKEIYVTPSHIKNIFVNMKRQGKDFFGKVTPLFETMMVQPQEDMGEDSKIPTDSHHIPAVTQSSISSQLQQKHKSKKSKKRISQVPQLSDSTHDGADEDVTTTSNDPLLSDEYVTTTSNDPLLSGSSTRVESSKDAGLGDQEDASKQGRMIADLDADEGVASIDES